MLAWLCCWLRRSVWRRGVSPIAEIGRESRGKVQPRSRCAIAVRGSWPTEFLLKRVACHRYRLRPKLDNCLLSASPRLVLWVRSEPRSVLTGVDQGAHDRCDEPQHLLRVDLTQVWHPKQVAPAGDTHQHRLDMRTALVTGVAAQVTRASS